MEIENSPVAENTQPAHANENSGANVPPVSDTRSAFEDKLAAVRGEKQKERPASTSAGVPDAENPVPATTQPGENQGRKEDQEKPFKRPRDNRRFDELTKRLHERESTIAELRRQLGQVEPVKSRSDYENDEKYIGALAKKSATEELMQKQLTDLENRQAAEQRLAWGEKVSGQVRDPRTFHGELAQAIHYGVIDEATEEFVMASDVGPKMLEVFLAQAKNPGWIANWQRMPAMKKAIALNDLEQRVSAAPKAAPQQNTAPAPSLAPAAGDRTPGAGGSARSAFETKLNSVRSNWR